jgi:hypothetical protein
MVVVAAFVWHPRGQSPAGTNQRSFSADGLSVRTERDERASIGLPGEHVRHPSALMLCGLTALTDTGLLADHPMGGGLLGLPGPQQLLGHLSQLLRIGGGINGATEPLDFELLNRGELDGCVHLSSSLNCR